MLTNDGESNMSLLQHRHIVPTVPDGCCQVGRVRILQEQNYHGDDGDEYEYRDEGGSKDMKGW